MSKVEFYLSMHMKYQCKENLFVTRLFCSFNPQNLDGMSTLTQSIQVEKMLKIFCKKRNQPCLPHIKLLLCLKKQRAQLMKIQIF